MNLFKLLKKIVEKIAELSSGVGNSTKIIVSDTAPTTETSPVPLSDVLWVDSSSGKYIPKIYQNDTWYSFGATYK